METSKGKKQELIQRILSQMTIYTPESGAYQMFECWLSKQSLQNLFMISLCTGKAK